MASVSDLYPACAIERLRVRADECRTQLGETACWPWNDTAVRANHYGQLGITTPKRRKILVHRMSFEVFVRPLQPEMHVLHFCDWMPCFNPRCLREGTHQENLEDARSRERFARGERQGHAKLTADAVREIRMRAYQGARHDHLATMYGVSPRTISDAITRKTWMHVL